MLTKLLGNYVIRALDIYTRSKGTEWDYFRCSITVLPTNEYSVPKGFVDDILPQKIITSLRSSVA